VQPAAEAQAAPAAAPTANGAAQAGTNGSNGHASATPANGSNGHAAAPQAASASNGAQTAKLSEAMLRIVGDKTGYPVEMLELGMDMEADLGIDSIKRVEILGAMRDEFPTLPQFSPEELGELRTLQQIVDYMEEAGRRESAPFDPRGAAASAVTPQSSLAELPPYDAQGIQRSVVGLRRLPAPDQLEIPVHGAVCLITDDGTPSTATVVLAMQVRGWNTVVLGLPGTDINPALNMTMPVHLPDWSEASIQSTLSAIESEHGAIGAYIQLGAPLLSGNGQLFVANDKAQVKLAFMMAKHLKSRLMQGNGTGRKAFIAVTRLDGALGTGADTGAGTITGGLFGLVKTLSLEWDGVFCRAVDIAPDASAEDVARCVTAELYDPNRLLTEVGYGALGRVTLAARQTVTNGAH
jgi:acyl carrier protein